MVLIYRGISASANRDHAVYTTEDTYTQLLHEGGITQTGIIVGQRVNVLAGLEAG
jgi:hypothetical protein